ncbi:MAG TPA: FecR domain-containing protein [Abditibacteriaceae bacterium]|jgi:type II secretory pathway pseudopilin PulG
MIRVSDIRKSRSKTKTRQSRGFTLTQLLVVISVLSVLAAVLLGAFSNSRTAAKRAQCDVRLKAIALALDAFHAETGRFPDKLEKLSDSKYQYLAGDALKCPAEVRADGSYAEYYVLRGPRDDSNLPILVCPLHEGQNHGAQAFIGRYTSQHQSAPAVLAEANNVYVTHPDGKGEMTAMAGMTLRGGDRVRTGSGGRALIRFADTSTATLEPSSNVTVLQSFVEGAAGAPYYTLLKQTLGNATYNVNHGSKFDVVTPTATAGARGTSFIIKVSTDSVTGKPKSELTVTDGKVVVSTLSGTVLAKNNTPIGITSSTVNLLTSPITAPLVRTLTNLLGL